MNLALLSPDQSGQIDGTLHRTLFGPLTEHIRGLSNSIAMAEAVVIPISYLPNEGPHRFQFREPELHGKPWVMVDFLEYFCQGGDCTHLLGVNASPIDHYQTEEWSKFAQWVRDNPPAVYFKRELFEKDRGENLLPVEFPCSLPIPEPVSREEFESRPCEVFNCWGLSNHVRSEFHGEVFMRAAEFGITVADSWEMMDHFIRHPEGRLWATIWTHCTRRIPIEQVMACQQQAKVSCSFPGSGVKCFRHGEAPVGAVMAMPYDSMAWSFPWEEGINCLRILGAPHLADQIPDCGESLLYDIYLAGQENIARYATDRYVGEYLKPEIERRLP